MDGAHYRARWLMLARDARELRRRTFPREKSRAIVHQRDSSPRFFISLLYLSRDAIPRVFEDVFPRRRFLTKRRGEEPRRRAFPRFLLVFLPSSSSSSSSFSFLLQPSTTGRRRIISCYARDTFSSAFILDDFQRCGHAGKKIHGPSTSRTISSNAVPSLSLSLSLSLSFLSPRGFVCNMSVPLPHLARPRNMLRGFDLFFLPSNGRGSAR